MDVFKQNRYLMITIILLVILNLSVLFLLWQNTGQQPVAQEKPPRTEQAKPKTQQVLKDELGFDDEQVKQFDRIRDEYRKQIGQLNHKIGEIKSQMFNEALIDNPQNVLPDSLLKLTLDKQLEIEQLTLKYFLDLKELCNPEQEEKLNLLIEELFRKPKNGDKRKNEPSEGKRPKPRDNKQPPRDDDRPPPRDDKKPPPRDGEKPPPKDGKKPPPPRDDKKPPPREGDKPPPPKKKKG